MLSLCVLPSNGVAPRRPAPDPEHVGAVRAQMVACIYLLSSAVWVGMSYVPTPPGPLSEMRLAEFEEAQAASEQRLSALTSPSPRKARSSPSPRKARS
jgi:hypothetical protein